MNVSRERGEKEAGQPSHGEEPDKPQRVEHRGVIRDGTLMKRGRPVEDLDGGGNGHSEAHRRKDQARVDRLAGHEHVMTPDEKGNDGDRYARERHESVTEYPLLRK